MEFCAQKYLSSDTLSKIARKTRFCPSDTKSRSCRNAADLLFCAPDTRNLAAYAAGSSVPSVGRPGRSDIFVKDKSDIVRSAHSDIIFAPNCRRAISLGDSRISLRSNITRRKANITAPEVLRRSTGAFLSPLTGSGAPSVSVYKSFLIEHHFCIFMGIFPPF